MNEFARFHPIVNFVYFLSVICFTVIFMNPYVLTVSFISGFSYSAMLLGKKALKTKFLLIFPLMIITACINPLFNHEGITILAYFPNGNPLTAESIFYGIFASLMIFSVICWFSCFNKIMTSDKIMCIFGNILPSLSLIFSMVLRFVPKFKQEFRQIRRAEKCLDNGEKKGVLKKLKSNIKLFSVIISYSLENSIETSDSMKCRGFGCAKRTAYSNYIFDKRDLTVICTVIVFDVYTVTGAFFGCFHSRFFPSFKTADFSPYAISVIIIYVLLCFLPHVIEIREALKWKKLRSKI